MARLVDAGIIMATGVVMIGLGVVGLYATIFIEVHQSDSALAQTTWLQALAVAASLAVCYAGDRLAKFGERIDGGRF